MLHYWCGRHIFLLKCWETWKNLAFVGKYNPLKKQLLQQLSTKVLHPEEPRALVSPDLQGLQHGCHFRKWFEHILFYQYPISGNKKHYLWYDAIQICQLLSIFSYYESQPDPSDTTFFLYLYQKTMLSDWRGSVNIMCYLNEHQKVVFSVMSWARSTFQSAYKPKFRFFAKSSVFASGLLGEVYSELFNESILKQNVWAKMFPEIMLWKGNGSRNWSKHSWHLLSNL